MKSSDKPRAIRGPLLTYTGDPFQGGLEATMVHEPDAIVAMADGMITACGPAELVAPRLPPGTEIRDYGKDALISAGFVDSHVHFPQLPMIAAYGAQLLEWLDRYTFPTELKYADKEFAREVARVFLQENLRNGITTSCVYCTVHPQSVDALFEEAEKLGLRLAAGKALMDRHAPDGLRDTAQSGYDQSQALLAKWHGRGRLLYAITPRYAGTSSPEQLAAAGALWREHPDCLMQTHIAETRDEVAWIKELFPDRRHYLDVYDHHGLCGRRAVFGHGIWLEDAELQRLHASGAAIAHCPTSNFFLGSGAFDLSRALKSERPVRVGLGTDIGAGTSFSILATLGEAYKAAQFHRRPLSAGHAYYLATRGGARALYLEDRIGSIAAGMEADLVVLDLRSTPLIDFRMRQAKDLAEQLFIQMILGTDIGTGTSFSILATLGEAYKAAQVHRRPLSAGHAYYLATRGGACALYLEDRIGSIAAGMEADLVVLDLRSTPLIDFRMRQAKDLAEQLFIQMILGDDRAVQATYVAGRLAYERGNSPVVPSGAARRAA